MTRRGGGGGIVFCMLRWPRRALALSRRWRVAKMVARKSEIIKLSGLYCRSIEGIGLEMYEYYLLLPTIQPFISYILEGVSVMAQKARQLFIFGVK